MVSKKLLAIPLCLILVVVPISLIINGEPEPESLFPAYKDGAWIDAFPAEFYIPPNSDPNVTFVDDEAVSASATTVSTTSAKLKMSILLALEDNFLAYYYYTPQFGKMNGRLYAELQIQRASKYFEQTFGIELVVVGVTSWHQDEEQDLPALYEVIKETGFYYGIRLEKYPAEALVAWTTKLKFGLSEAGGIALFRKYACLVRYCAYWMDDNLVQHEVSHLFNATDGTLLKTCYSEDCVMSYREKWVNRVEEDGVVWVNYWCKIGVTFLTNNWCKRSQDEMIEWKWIYAGNDDICIGDC